MVRKLKTISSRLVCFLALVALATSCLKEDRTDCDTPRTFTLTVRAYDNSGDEVAESEVKEVRLFVFDADMCLTEYIDTQVGQSVTVVVPKGEDAHVVGWGNLVGGLQNYTSPVVGMHKSDFIVSPLPDTRAVSYAQSPDDLFMGDITIEPAEQEGEKILPIYRQMGSMTVLVRGLKQYAGFSSDDYRIIVHETPSAMDFYGKFTGSMVAYRPQGSFVTNSGEEELHAPAFNLAPTDAEMYIDIYHDTQLVASVSDNTNGSKIAVSRGELTNVLIVFTGKGTLEDPAVITVSVSLTGWGDEQVWKVF